MTRAWWRTTFRLWLIAAAVGAFLAMPTACVDTLADALVGNEDPKAPPPDTVVIVCHHHDPRPECKR